MKQFLYLDTDIVNSIIAQSENGLVGTFSKENDTSEMSGSSRKKSIDPEVKAGGSIAKLVKVEADLVGRIEAHNDRSFTTTSREIVSKTLHDAAFNIAYEEINVSKLKQGDDSVTDPGEYIEVSRYFDFVDLDYMMNLFEKDGIIDYVKKSESDNIKANATKDLGKLNRDQRRAVNNDINAKVRKLIEENDKKYDDAAIALQALRTLIPYNRMLISNDGYLIPLNDKYFRVDCHDLGFKYGGEITCVGMISNIIGKDTNPNDDKNIFATIQFVANEALRTILPTNKSNLLIIHPIAVYYGN